MLAHWITLSVPYVHCERSVFNKAVIAFDVNQRATDYVTLL